MPDDNRYQWPVHVPVMRPLRAYRLVGAAGVEPLTEVVDLQFDIMSISDLDMLADDILRAELGALMGRAMAEAVERQMMNMMTAFFSGLGVPQFDSEAEMRRWFQAYGIDVPASLAGQISFTTARTLMMSAKTLRQRCFARLFRGITAENEMSFSIAGMPTAVIAPFSHRLSGLMAACYRSKVARAALAALPISRPAAHETMDPEVPTPLQDLADIVAWEATHAFTDEYYPGVADVAPMTDDEVDAVMAGMQREISREAFSRRKQPPFYSLLPRARQVALAERRRYWYGAFGITPRNWKKGTWSLWRVTNAPYPEGCPRTDY